MLRPSTLLLALVIAGSGAAQTRTPIIIDHNTTDLAKIPDTWLQASRALVLHYAYTSHGSHILSGLEALARENSKYAFRAYSGQPSALPQTGGAVRIFTGQPNQDYITPELYWSEQAGRDLTNAVANTGLFQYSMWSWCGQQSENTTPQVQAYLVALDSFESTHPAMRYIHMTGHTDGGSETLKRNNDWVRAHALSHDHVLFDFADIESYDPAGNYYPQTDDSCSWCTNWCTTHPADCQVLPSDCAHSHPFNCKLKAKAFWWMMARLAGWDGTPAAGYPGFDNEGVVNGASFARGAISAGEIISIFGKNYGPEQIAMFALNQYGRIPTQLAGTQVLFDGVPGPMIHVLRGQLATIVPYSVAGKSLVNVEILDNGRRSGIMQVPVAPAAPGIFSSNSSGKGQGAILNQDYSSNRADNPALRGTVTMFFVTGEGDTTPVPEDGQVAGYPPPWPPKPRLRVTAFVGGIEAEVTYAGGAPGLVAGLMQVNVRVPPGAPNGDAVPVIIKVGDYATPAGITMAIR